MHQRLLLTTQPTSFYYPLSVFIPPSPDNPPPLSLWVSKPFEGHSLFIPLQLKRSYFFTLLFADGAQMGCWVF